MLVKDLIAELQKHDPELQVKIHPHSDLFIEDNLVAFGDVGNMGVDTLYLNNRDIYEDEEEWKESLECEYDPEIDEEQTFEEHFENCKKTADKVHALFIKAVV